MQAEMIFLPLIVHVWLIFGLYIFLKKAKEKAVLAGQVDRKKASLNDLEWTEDVRKILNNIKNQFETPILFYVLTLVAYVTDSVNNVLISASFIYVASRFVHAYIHTTSNYVPNRLKAFTLGLLILLGESLYLFLSLI